MNSSTDSTVSEVDYEVERIDGKKVLNGVTYYLIKWKNYSTNENTWEPIGNLSCEEIIEEYEANQCCSVESALEPKQIKNKRTKGGKTEYLVKWSDLSESWLTSIDIGILDDTLPKLISEFEKTQLKRKRQKQLKSKSMKKKSNVMGPQSGINKSTFPKFVENIDRIIDMKRIKSEVMYLVEYNDTHAVEWVPMDIIKYKHPQKVIEFYEGSITWEK